jgi:microcystin degradation protein MlrC
MRPRIAAAQISHETNVFSAVPTDLAAFEAAGLDRGTAILPKAHGTNSAFGGFATGAEEHGFDLLPLISVWATPSGLVTRQTIEALEDMLADGLRCALAEGPLDGVLLALHGAMVTEGDEDGDAHFLELVRAIVGPETPVVATLDLHANISARMVAGADVLIGYDTYPHVDMADRAHEACGVLARLIRREIRPTAALRKPPMLPTSQNMPTDRDPMRALIARAHAIETDPRVLNVTVAGGFPPADVADAGFSVLVTTSGDQSLADRLADELAADAWARRDGFLGGVTSFADAAKAIHALPAQTSEPLVVVDIGDNPWTGGPGDSAELVRFLTAEGVSGAAVALVADPETVARCAAAGVGATIDVELGGKTDRLHGDPFACRAYVRLLGDGTYVNDGPMMTGLPVNLGPTALIVVDGVEVLVTTRAETPIDLNVFGAHGIEPTRRRVIGLKGKGHFRAAFEPIASRVILVEGPGITGADLSRLTFKRVRRPIWPLDADVTYP